MKAAVGRRRRQKARVVVQVVVQAENVTAIVAGGFAAAGDPVKLRLPNPDLGVHTDTNSAFRPARGGITEPTGAPPT
jgi:hypothetical protein